MISYELGYFKGACIMHNESSQHMYVLSNMSITSS